MVGVDGVIFDPDRVAALALGQLQSAHGTTLARARALRGEACGDADAEAHGDADDGDRRREPRETRGERRRAKYGRPTPRTRGATPSRPRASRRGPRRRRRRRPRRCRRARPTARTAWDARRAASSEVEGGAAARARMREQPARDKLKFSFELFFNFLSILSDVLASVRLLVRCGARLPSSYVRSVRVRDLFES